MVGFPKSGHIYFMQSPLTLKQQYYSGLPGGHQLKYTCCNVPNDDTLTNHYHIPCASESLHPHQYSNWNHIYKLAVSRPNQSPSHVHLMGINSNTIYFMQLPLTLKQQYTYCTISIYPQWSTWWASIKIYLL